MTVPCGAGLASTNTLGNKPGWGGGGVGGWVELRRPDSDPECGTQSQYYGAHRGVTSYNFSSDPCTGFHGIVIPGTLRDSMYILDGVLEHQTPLRPLEIMTDTAGVSDVVFGCSGCSATSSAPA